MIDELKPCPFCGGKASIRHTIPVFDERIGKACGYFAMCNGCLTSSDNYNTAAECADHWNSRVSS